MKHLRKGGGHALMVSLLLIPLLFMATAGGRRKESWDQSTLVDANNQFAWTLFQHLPIGDSNSCFSPFSAFVTLSLARDGAGGGTRTEPEQAVTTGTNAKVVRG